MKKIAVTSILFLAFVQISQSISTPSQSLKTRLGQVASKVNLAQLDDDEVYGNSYCQVGAKQADNSKNNKGSNQQMSYTQPAANNLGTVTISAGCNSGSNCGSASSSGSNLGSGSGSGASSCGSNNNCGSNQGSSSSCNLGGSSGNQGSSCSNLGSLPNLGSGQYVSQQCQSGQQSYQQSQCIPDTQKNIVTQSNSCANSESSLNENGNQTHKRTFNINGQITVIECLESCSQVYGKESSKGTEQINSVSVTQNKGNSCSCSQGGSSCQGSSCQSGSQYLGSGNNGGNSGSCGANNGGNLGNNGGNNSCGSDNRACQASNNKLGGYSGLGFDEAE